jgi:maltooligosyltrehalose trehalohydrolase
MRKDELGWFEVLDVQGKAGDLYEFELDGKLTLPDPASRFQPNGVYGPSQVIDGKSYSWKDKNWKRPELADLIIYELHVGTFTGQGTFVSAIDRLQHVRDLGANTVELMPAGEFPGERNWGYDVVLPFAPAHSYGTPEDLRRLVDAAHGLGLAVIMDVVYNHVCGEPNVLEMTSPRYFDKEDGNAWGSALNFDGPESAAVREFFIQNAEYWLEEFHVDGLRLDATHAIRDNSQTHILSRIAEEVRLHGGFVIAEDDRNDGRLLRPVAEGGLGMDATWADDFHHVMKMKLKPEPIGHFASYAGTLEELKDAIEHGWLFRGQEFRQWKKPRGTEAIGRPASQFVYCLSNHDQTGNRPIGERLNHLIDARAYRAASMFFLLLPYTPMLFMGQEWAAGTPFVFFTDHGGKFGAGVSEGRLREFKKFGSEWQAEMIARMPNPEDTAAFQQSKLDWREIETPAHQLVLALYRVCLRLRNEDPVLRRRGRSDWKVWTDHGCIFLRFGLAREPARLLVAHFDEGADVTIEPGWQTRLSSEMRCFGGADQVFHDEAGGRISFVGPATILLERES